MTKVEFRPTLKSINVANDKVKMVIEIDKDRISHSLGELAMLEGGKITAAFRPETISYQVPYDRTSNAPAIRYEQAEDGTWVQLKEEQTNLLGNDDIENREFAVELDVIDEFIQSCKLDYPNGIDPKEILDRLEDGESLALIALDYEMDETGLEKELDEARNYYAPYAAAWDEKRQREVK